MPFDLSRYQLDDPRRPQTPWQEFKERYGEGIMDFRRMWKQMFGYPPSAAAETQYWTLRRQVEPKPLTSAS